MEPLYKVGDIVLVKAKLDDGYDSYDYRFTFIDKMMDDYGGTVCTIKEVDTRDVNPNVNPNVDQIPDDGYLYHLEEDDGQWSWASSMFESEF